MSFNKTKLFCIPFSGGNAYSYSGFKKYLTEDIELHNLELPGRGKRIAEPLLNSIGSMTEDLFNQIKDEIGGSYAIWGHSLGALLGISLCRYISIKNSNLPKIVFLSGQKAPALLKPDEKHLLPDDEFINMIREMGGTPEELLTDKSFLQYFLPVIRADFQSIAGYNYVPKEGHLDIPITVMFGNEEEISDEDAGFWQLETDNTLTVHRFTGGHFFIFNNADKICRLIIEKIKTAT